MLRQNQNNWTEDDMRKIISMRKEGRSMQEVAAEFPERKPQAIATKMARMGLSINDAHTRKGD